MTESADKSSSGKGAKSNSAKSPSSGAKNGSRAGAKNTARTDTKTTQAKKPQPTANNSETNNNPTKNSATSKNNNNRAKETMTKTDTRPDDKVNMTTPATARPRTEPENQVALAPAPVVVKSGGKVLGLLALLLSLLALAGVAFMWYQTQVEGVRAESKLSSGVTEIGGQINRLGDSISRLQTEQANVVTQEQLTTKLLESSNTIDLQMRDLKDDQAELLDDQAELLGAVKKINSDLKKGVNEFVLDEVSQLLKLANNSAVFAGNVDSAVNALRLADIQLKELADPRFAEVRRKINQEIGQLESVDIVDVERISASLSALSDKIPSLPLENEPPKGTAISVVDAPSTEKTNWRSELRRMWSDIANSVQVQRVDQPPKPLLAPQQRYFLNQNLQLNLAKAEIALLQDKPDLYQRSLETSIGWLRDYFDLKDAGVKRVLEQLNELKAQRLGTKLPSVAGSYTLLQTIKGGQ